MLGEFVFQVSKCRHSRLKMFSLPQKDSCQNSCRTQWQCQSVRVFFDHFRPVAIFSNTEICLSKASCEFVTPGAAQEKFSFCCQ